MAKLKVVHKWVGLGRVQSFMLILGRVGSLYLWVGLGRVKKIGPTSSCVRDIIKGYLTLLDLTLIVASDLQSCCTCDYGLSRAASGV